MVRTRGLGRALGSVIGRALGRKDHCHSDDVPQRRRPTTSTCRQWEIAPVAEDAPDMAGVTKDVLKKLLMMLRGFQVGRVTHQC